MVICAAVSRTAVVQSGEDASLATSLRTALLHERVVGMLREQLLDLVAVGGNRLVERNKLAIEFFCRHVLEQPADPLAQDHDVGGFA